MELNQLINNIKDRQNLLGSELKSLQNDLELVYEKNFLESGVIDRGYYTAFNNVLEQYRRSRIIDRYMISEEQYTNNGQLIKIPVVDITKEFDNKRLFILPKNF